MPGSVSLGMRAAMDAVTPRLAMHAAVGMGAGALVGALRPGGLSVGGMVQGAMGGMILGAAGGEGLPRLSAEIASAPAMKDYSGLMKVSEKLSTNSGRAALWAGGGLLGGAMFRGQGRDYRRGFNQNRGSRAF